MKNIITYAQQYQDSFSERPCNAVDSLILSQLVMLHLDDIFPATDPEADRHIQLKELADPLLQDLILEGIWNKKDMRELLHATAASSRFRDIKLKYFTNKIDLEEEKQFAALCFELTADETYVCYRGTDHFLVSWKEDFNMAYRLPVPAQLEAVAYLNRVATLLPNQELILGGHSKGGNIAIYAAIYCESTIQDRIKRIYNHDGPGFREEIFLSDPYGKIRSRIFKSMPRSSIVGMLLEYQDDYSVVKNHYPWIVQHNPFTWVVEDDDFAYADDLDPRAISRSKQVKAWLAQMDDEAREIYVNTIYEILTASGAKTYFELKDDWFTRTRAVLQTMKDLDPEIKQFMRDAIRSFFELNLNKK